MMFEAAVTRIRSRWPSAQLTVHCSNPSGLAASDVGSKALSPDGATGWNAAAIAVGQSPLLFRRMARHIPALTQRLAQAALRLKRREPLAVRTYLAEVRNADLVLVTGTGGINDVFHQHAATVLNTLQLAVDAGAATALMGQGIGPLSRPGLRRHARSVLPRLDLIAAREGLMTAEVLREVGVAASRVMVTGDDAIATAYRSRPPELGTALGVNLRTAPYACISDEVVNAVGAAIRNAAVEHRTRLVPIQISSDPAYDDRAAADAMLADGSRSLPIASVADLLARIGGCRVVVAGSYHAAVLALSMGIPTVAVASSDYYIAKFRGLAAQFGEACCTVELTSGAPLAIRLERAIRRAWDTALECRAPLLHAASLQMAAGDAAYDRLFELLETRMRARGRACDRAFLVRRAGDTLRWRVR